MAFVVPPPAVPDVVVAFPRPHILLVTLNRPRQLNALPSTHHAPLDGLFCWYDAEPSLRCAVITGAGRAFCAGADLKEWHERASVRTATRWPAGFGGLSRRTGRKPVIAAVNGLCLGGGLEMAVNCDLVVAAATASFALPEVRRGVVAIAGALPRIAQTLGRQRASEMALTGRTFSAAEMARWGIVNEVVAVDADADAADVANAANTAVVEAALRLAQTIADNSPDAVVVSREGLRLGSAGLGPERAADLLERGLYRQMVGAANMREGLRSFVEKRAAVWVDSKL